MTIGSGRDRPIRIRPSCQIPGRHLDDTTQEETADEGGDQGKAIEDGPDCLQGDEIGRASCRERV